MAGLRYAAGSVAMLTGAFAVGWVLHHVLVVGDLAATAPAAVLATLAGAGLIAVGYALERRFDPSDYVPASEGDDGEEGEDGDEYDERFAPVPEERLRAEADRDEAASGSDDDRNAG